MGYSAYENPKLMQHPLMKKNNFTKRAIPVLIHGDGAEFEYNNSLMTISMTGLLKEGSVADTSLLLASWPKNSTVKGVEDTWRVIWHWLSWDFNQLFDNRYHGQDPWKGPLPEDREELAGQAICGHDLFVVLWGVLGDHEFFQNHLGLPNTSNQAPNPACQWCLCNKLNMKNHWFNFDDAAPWMKGGPREAADHPINTIVGMTSGHYLVDWLHTVDLGIASHALANVLFNIVYDKLNHMSRAKAMELVVDKLLAYPSHHGSDFRSMELKHITNPQRPHKEYPLIHHMKAAHVRHMVPMIHGVFGEFAGPSPYDAFQEEMLKALAKLYDVMHSGGLVFTPSEYAAFKQAAFCFLGAYKALAEEAEKAGLKRYNIVPKFHYFVHLVQQSELLNPRACWCYGGEDLVGRASTLAHSCTRGTPQHKVALTMMDKYRVAVHVKWSMM